MTYLGKPIKRLEDPRLLRGEGRFVADISLPGMVHCAVLRSPHAHALITAIDTSEARDLPGVVAVLTAQDLGLVGERDFPLVVPHPNLDPVLPRALARDEVIHVGQAVAIVAAENRAIAEDALELIQVEYQVLEAVMNPERALDEDAPRTHSHRATNLAAHVRQGTGDVERAFERADRIVRGRFRVGRLGGQPLETRGVAAVYDPTKSTEQLTVWATTQSPHTARFMLSSVLDLPPERIRMIAPDVGGGFGTKNRFYPEEVLVPFLALRLGRPVSWIEDRVEHFSSSYHERDQIHEAEMALRADGRILALRDRFINDNGALSPYGLIVPLTTCTMMRGPYDIPNYQVDMYCVYTNKVGIAPYRGAGRPQATYVMERMMDLAAHEMEMDPVEFRRVNLIQPDQFPYDTGLTGRDGNALIYDSGDYPATLDDALHRSLHAGFREERQRLRAEGRYLGIGVAAYVEMAGLGAYESASVTVKSDGTVVLVTGATNQGQGHPTSLAQMCADRLGVPIESIEFRSGDTAAIPYGLGTFASRVAYMAGNAVSKASQTVRAKALRLASQALEVSPDDLELVDGLARVRGVPDRNIQLAQLAAALNAPNLTSYSMVLDSGMPPDMDPGLTATEYYHSQGLTYSNGTHVAVVEVDPATGQVKILRYVVVHDCGKVLNPLILDGQICGGVAQGIGNALYEEVLYDAGGQLVTTTYLDYLIPSMTEVPDIEVGHRETPSPFNPEGIKGAGEGGAIPVPAVIASAVDDALSTFGIHTNRVPITPAYLRSLLREKPQPEPPV